MGAGRRGSAWIRLRRARQSQPLGAAIGAKPAVAEQALDLDCEISVMAARSPSGEVRSLSRRAQSS